jgi:predicted nuclease of restriction endonuclease-like (RecB) superfamily
MSTDLVFYGELLSDLKTRVRQAQLKASLAVNAEMILLYWDVGQMIHQRQQQDGWGTGVIPRLSRDLRNELPELKGFSERNIGYMIRFAREYDVSVILQQPVAKLAEPVESSAIIPQSACPRIAQICLPKFLGVIISC